MALFQQSVLKKYLNDLNKESVHQAWLLFENHFHNPAIQQNILNAKEEEYQEDFVRDLFVTVLGYTLNPQPDYNFVLEKKTEADSTKSDGAILHGGKVVAVIELKDTATTDLDKVEKQAFGYKHRHRDCTYVITSNFQKLRFYINDAIDYEEFDLFTLTQERFALLYCCLNEQQIFKNIPLLIKQASLTQEEIVTKKLYADYSGFRKKLFYNITELNPQYSKIELFQKTQKLLDRFLFILFAEDRMLVPANSVRKILQQWQQLKEMDAAQPLYQRFKLYFGYLNNGRQDKEEIFAYNGGLFAADEILDNIKIDDTILYDSCIALSNYDFQTEVDVNILGHIFEHSLNEIEELQAEAEGKPLDKAKTKRKKDGVFYTPRYITKYIVANTVGTLCEQKKQELSINEEVFAYRKQKDKKREKLVKLLDDYRQWLLQLTICDPACGSGAFLNQALEFLIAEHRYIDELKANLFGDAFVLTNLDNEILEHNLFGVDINEEGVEIARLSLWLRTAKKDRKLSSLTNHIQCGNSLIDDPAIAGDKAFNWQKAFPKIFAKGGFDVVIGNPPYGRYTSLSDDVKNYLKANKIYGPTSDLAEFFINKSLKDLVKKKGFFSFIIPKGLTYVKSWSDIRNKLLTEVSLLKLFDTSKSFEEVLYEMIVFTVKNDNNYKDYIDCGYFDENEIIEYIFPRRLQSDSIFYLGFPSNYIPILEKIKNHSKPISNYIEFWYGKGGVTPEVNFEKKGIKVLTGKEIGRYLLNEINQSWYIEENKLNKIDIEKSLKEKVVVQDIVAHIMNPKPHIKLTASLDISNQFCLNTVMCFSDNNKGVSNKFLLGLINSKFLSFYFYYFVFNQAIRTMHFMPGYSDLIPIPDNFQNYKPHIEPKAEIMLAKNKELQELKQQLLQLLQSNFPDVQFSKKLEQWPSLSFAEFLKELSKQKIKPTLAQQAEWMKYFEEQKTKALALQTVIDTTDTEIDAMVYALYGLTEEEIKIVEGA